jgi:cysteinyl-tRNA synthetase
MHLFIEDILGLTNVNANGNGSSEKDKALDKVMQMVLDMRQKAKEEKNWAVSDQIRDELSAAGVIVKDTPDGAVWEI